MWLGIMQLIYLSCSILFFLAAYSRKRWQLRLALVTGMLGCAIHLGFIIQRGMLARRLPITNTYETLILFSLLLMAAYLAAYRRYGLPALGGFASLVAAILLSACSLLSPEIEPLLPSLKSNWLLFHVLASFLGYAAFGLAFASSVAYLLLDSGLRRLLKSQIVPATEGITDFLDWFTYRAIAFGFPLLTLGIVTGAIWADTCWGSYWNWDPKETWSFITWFVYAGCLHMRFAGMRGRTSAIMAVVGFGCVIFTYMGVNYWLAGLHDYA
ncbi:MAG: c-type cytochrome biogenesis protein CcsB [Candidatus Lindowbacteria bacterium]|nr:c-type cytochrome biogenesis protein CcsB [Candidatus Lindowbacteria bacterium]